MWNQKLHQRNFVLSYFKIHWSLDFNGSLGLSFVTTCSSIWKVLGLGVVQSFQMNTFKKMAVRQTTLVIAENSFDLKNPHQSLSLGTTGVPRPTLRTPRYPNCCRSAAGNTRYYNVHRSSVVMIGKYGNEPNAHQDSSRKMNCGKCTQKNTTAVRQTNSYSYYGLNM